MLFATMLAVAGCATQLQVVGRYAGQLSQSNIQKIAALIQPSGITHHVYTRIAAARPDKVRLNTAVVVARSKVRILLTQPRNTSQRSKVTGGGLPAAKMEDCQCRALDAMIKTSTEAIELTAT